MSPSRTVLKPARLECTRCGIRFKGQAYYKEHFVHEPSTPGRLTPDKAATGCPNPNCGARSSSVKFEGE